MGELHHFGRRIENRLKPRDRTHDGVADHRRDQTGHQRLDLEILRVKNFRADDGARQRRFENGGDAGSQSGGQGDVAFPRREFEGLGDAGAGGGPDLRDRPFATGSQTAADGDGGGDQFEDGRSESDLFIGMKGPDGRVGADARRFRGQFPDQQTADQTGGARDQRQQPRPGHVENIFSRTAFTARHRRRVAHNRAEHVMRGQMNAPNQRQRPEPRANADQNADESPLAEKGCAFSDVGNFFGPNPL